MDGIAVGTPLGVQGNPFSFNRCQIHDILPFSIGGSAAIGLGIPAREGVAGFGIAVGRQVCRLVIGHALAGRISAVGGVAIELDGIAVGTPLGVQCYHIAICSCQVLYILTVAIGSSRTVRLGIPAGKGVPSFGIAVGRQVGCRIVGHGLIICTAAICRVTVKLYCVLVRFPESVKSIVIRVYRSNIVCSIGMAGTITFGVP